MGLGFFALVLLTGIAPQRSGRIIVTASIGFPIALKFAQLQCAMRTNVVWNPDRIVGPHAYQTDDDG